MKNLKRLSRTELKKVGGGKACSLTVQQADGSYKTYQGTCQVTVDSVVQTSSGGGTQFQYEIHRYCEAGFGEVGLTSNGGVSRCNS
ncbi:bacteriocin-like protein [Elizabethkingia meningoseptica]|uniref:bacteriocin-like protein n=1 Tax=Elizabethkingia meningoseptica TaxID=238 RepID=UPI000B35985A|nr:hypothetical protein [Elizabethkingia meningoseptica]MCL1676814.1 hypothetical protein [Elizabethkingia meningoseptica]MCL1686581.1 hypothetical protein [Elizabethkingia meningoseptica]